MPAQNPRINVTFEKPTLKLLKNLAEHQHQSMASLVRDLALEALELREDFYLSKLAEKLDKPGVKTHSHDEAWK